jgi:hypothetical protein
MSRPAVNEISLTLAREVIWVILKIDHSETAYITNSNEKQEVFS